MSNISSDVVGAYIWIIDSMFPYFIEVYIILSEIGFQSIISLSISSATIIPTPFFALPCIGPKNLNTLPFLNLCRTFVSEKVSIN